MCPCDSGVTQQDLKNTEQEQYQKLREEMEGLKLEIQEKLDRQEKMLVEIRELVKTKKGAATSVRGSGGSELPALSFHGAPVSR